MTNQPPFASRHPIVGVGTFKASARAKQLVMQVLESNRLSYGPMMERFEIEFARLHGARFGIMSNSGTSALQLALQAMKELHGWADGDEVIVPAVTFVATANIVLHNRMIPKLVDIEPRYYGINPELIEQAISPRTRAIIPVHLFGQSADMDPIKAIARKHSLLIIEDSAETMFAKYKGRRVGTLGDIGCFSTYVAHLLVTGVGGLNVTNEPEYAIKIRSLLNHGRDSIYISIDDDKNKSVEELRTIVERQFRFVSVGHSFRATEMEAALGLAQLEEWQPMIEQRRRNASFLTNALRRHESNLQVPEIRPDCEHSFMMYPLVARNQDKRDLVNFLEENGIETRDMLPLTNQPVYHRLLGWQEDDYPVAKMINDNGFYVACHQDLLDSDLEYIAECFDKFFRKEDFLELDKNVALVMFADSSTAIADQGWLEAIPLELFSKVVVVDAGMPDRVNTFLEERGFTILKANGKDLLDVVVEASDPSMPDAVVLFPCNDQWNANDISRILIALRRGYDMVVASRFVMGGERQGQHGRLRSLGNRTFNFLANVLFGSNLTDSFSSFRAVRRSKLAEVIPPGHGLAKLYALSLRAVKHNWRIQEIPTVEVARSKQQVIFDSMSSVLPSLAALGREWASKRIQPSDKSAGRR